MVSPNAKITLTEDGEIIIISDNETADVLFSCFESSCEYKDYPSIKAIKRVPKSKDLRNFSNVEKKKIFQETACLGASMACQDTNVPTKIIKENADIFTDFVHPSINASINSDDFPSFLKLTNMIPVF